MQIITKIFAKWRSSFKVLCNFLVTYNIVYTQFRDALISNYITSYFIFLFFLRKQTLHFSLSFFLLYFILRSFLRKHFCHSSSFIYVFEEKNKTENLLTSTPSDVLIILTRILHVYRIIPFRIISPFFHFHFTIITTSKLILNNKKKTKTKVRSRRIGTKMNTGERREPF